MEQSWLFREGPFGKKGFFSLFTLTMSFWKGNFGQSVFLNTVYF